MMVSSTSEKTASITLGWLRDDGLAGSLAQDRINDLTCSAVLCALENVVLDQCDRELELAHSLAGLGDFDRDTHVALLDFTRVGLANRDDDARRHRINVAQKARIQVAPGEPPFHGTVDAVFG